MHGASGAVGNAAVQIARAIGSVVVGTAGTKDGMDVVTDCGAHHVFNHNHKSYEKKMVEHIGGEGFDVIIEHLANINLGHDVQMVKEGELAGKYAFWRSILIPLLSPIIIPKPTLKLAQGIAFVATRKNHTQYNDPGDKLAKV